MAAAWIMDVVVIGGWVWDRGYHQGGAPRMNSTTTPTNSPLFPTYPSLHLGRRDEEQPGKTRHELRHAHFAAEELCMCGCQY